MQYEIRDLISIDEIKHYMRIEHSEDDRLIQDIIHHVCAESHAYLGKESISDALKVPMMQRIANLYNNRDIPVATDAMYRQFRRIRI